MISILTYFIFKIFTSILKLIYGILYILLLPKKLWNRRHLRKVFFMHPSHLVSDMDAYKIGKQNRDNKRPASINKVNKDGSVGLSKMSKQQVSKKQKKNNEAIPITQGKYKGQKISTIVIEVDPSTNQKFRPGKPPLTESEGKISKKDYKTLKRVQKQKKRPE